jgi:two-component system OmpR family response regulator
VRLLLVEDDVQLASRLGERLRGAGFAVDVATNRAEGEARPTSTRSARSFSTSICPMARAWISCDTGARRIACPVIILTARGSWQDKVEGLNAGADDFVVKPVRFEELLARLHAVWRRQQGAADAWIEKGALRLNPADKKAELEGEELALSRMEFRLLHLFLRHAGKPLSQSEIMDHLYDLDSERQANAVEVLIGRLRRKIGSERIETLRGFGYRLLA